MLSRRQFLFSSGSSLLLVAGRAEIKAPLA